MTKPIRWLMTYYSANFIGYYLELTSKTDKPCHLTLWWSDSQYIVERIAADVRGFLMICRSKYSPIPLAYVEQLEPSDTLTHTFHFGPWEYCTKRWFFFTATVEGQLTISNTPVFYSHYRGIENIYPAWTTHRTIRSNWGTWLPTWQGINLEIGPWHGPPTYQLVAEATLTASYWILRSFLTFDTRDLPPTTKVIGAMLRLYGKFKSLTSGTGYPDIYVTRGFHEDPPIAADWALQNPETTILASRAIPSLVINAYNDFLFNADGLKWINPGGLTKFCIRQQYDLTNNPPVLGSNSFGYRSSLYSIDTAPLLVVSYWQ